jgi:hypothetical protein
MAEDLQTVPHTAYIELLRNNKKRKHKIEAECKQMANQRKKLQDQVDSCCQQIEKLQHQLLNRDVHRGRNTVSWGRFNKYDHAYNEIISNFCKKQLFPHYKFLHKSWKGYNTMDKGSHYSKIHQEIDLTNYVRQNPSEQEYFWMNKMVPMINKKYCTIRANITVKLRNSI